MHISHSANLPVNRTSTHRVHICRSLGRRDCAQCREGDIASIRWVRPGEFLVEVEIPPAPSVKEAVAQLRNFRA